MSRIPFIQLCTLVVNGQQDQQALLDLADRGQDRAYMHLGDLVRDVLDSGLIYLRLVLDQGRI